MSCTHDAFKCTNGVFYCLKCGAVIPNPYEGKGAHAPVENAPEGPKKAAKRKAKKEE